jgi:murein L,D-transpeptidase YcbB/YkuD
MSILHTLNAVGTALAGAVGATNGAAPPADPVVVRALLSDVGMVPVDDLADALRRFQARSGLVVDGVAGPKTVHVLVRYAAEARHMRELGLAA